MEPFFPVVQSPPVLTVSQLTAEIQDLLESAFPALWVAGEISNLSRPQSGHVYFTLKDESAQVKAVLWKTAAARLQFDLQDGLEVLCQGRLDVYPPRGTYQINVEAIHPRGMGALELALRRLREKLQAEGLFDVGRKRPLPRFPQRVGLITSPTGAAIHDILKVLHRRWQGIHVLVAPVRVQGEGAAREIAAGIELCNRVQPPLDCLIVGRGGGSLEDLWAFNEEPVVRAIAASRVPVVSAVGHEVDVTLADLAADVRAATPSQAAELIVPAAEDLRAVVRQHHRRLLTALRNRAAAARARVDDLARRRALRQPCDIVSGRAQQLDELAARATRAARQRLVAARRTWEAKAMQLESLSPLAVLARGYSVTENAITGEVLRSAAQAAPGIALRTILASGRLLSRVEEVEDGRT